MNRQRVWWMMIVSLIFVCTGGIAQAGKPDPKDKAAKDAAKAEKERQRAMGQAKKYRHYAERARKDLENTRKHAGKLKDLGQKGLTAYAQAVEAYAVAAEAVASAKESGDKETIKSAEAALKEADKKKNTTREAFYAYKTADSYAKDETIYEKEKKSTPEAAVPLWEAYWQAKEDVRNAWVAVANAAEGGKVCHELNPEKNAAHEAKTKLDLAYKKYRIAYDEAYMQEKLGKVEATPALTEKLAAWKQANQEMLQAQEAKMQAENSMRIAEQKSSTAKDAVYTEIRACEKAACEQKKMLKAEHKKDKKTKKDKKEPVTE